MKRHRPEDMAYPVSITTAFQSFSDILYIKRDKMAFCSQTHNSSSIFSWSKNLFEYWQDNRHGLVGNNHLC